MANKRRRRSQAGSSITEADLLQIEKTEKRRADRPKGLSLGRIHLAENVFQWRNRNENIVQSDSHQTELARILRSTGKPLDPIVVTAVGKKFYLVEGHHRILAYRKVRWDGPVPVKHFEGTVSEAQDEALRLNIKDKLRMTRAEKFDAAFRLVKRGTQTYAAIKEATTVSLRTINTMAKVQREYPKAAEHTSWRNALWSYTRRLEIADDDNDRKIDWREEKAQKLAQQLIKNVGVDFVRGTDITARALEIIDEALPRALVSEWIDIAQEVLLAAVREENNEKAEELLLALIYPAAGSANALTDEGPEL